MAISNNSFLDRIKNGFEKAGCNPGDGLVLAVSGGLDSVALLYATIQLWPEAKERIIVAHVNHALRAAESDADEDIVRELCRSNGLRFELLRLEQGSLRRESGASLEEAARAVRYQFLTETADRYSLLAVATAHHMDDQAETVLHNIIRGTSLRGLRGMEASRPLKDNISLLRPMLQMSRREISEYVSQNQFAFRTDASNRDLMFTRNRVRQQLLPLLKADFNTAADQNLILLAQQAQETVDLMDALAEKILSDVVLEQQPCICRLDRKKLAGWPLQMVRHIMSVVWIRQAWPRQKMTFRHYERLSVAVCSDVECREDFPGGIRLNVSSDVVRLSMSPTPI